MRALRAANAWFDRMPWYVDGMVCLIPGIAALVVCWFIWGGGVGAFALLVVAAGVLTGRYVYHRRLPEPDVR